AVVAAGQEQDAHVWYCTGSASMRRGETCSTDVLRYAEKNEDRPRGYHASAPYEICMRRTARLAIHRTNALRSSNPRIASGRDAGAAGAASNLTNVGAPSSSGAGTGQSDCR